MNLLPAAILALVSILSLQDREVLAYMITRSMKSTNPATVSDEKKKTQKKFGMPHKPSVFDCECFDCYTSYWFRWDSSPNHELIHQAIKAFEDHLSNPSKKVRGKKRDKSGRFDSGLDLSTPLRQMESPSQFGEDYYIDLRGSGVGKGGGDGGGKRWCGGEWPQGFGEKGTVGRVRAVQSPSMGALALELRKWNSS
ncbi:LOW QUALITY PROTEIN: hypothetical protein RJ640_011080 [Escallonia rubra]|uniref:Uncharacterized protein n=1 Tax=Escallonia rubra TaxID=112253 RepID=A0AA88RQ17_9ASTE|nr:LOW QUALITY PROTEIN: hypothetical protein RJ640_011080 [Escallonia rubra]